MPASQTLKRPDRSSTRQITRLKEGHRAVKQMEAWQQRALPADLDKALSLYKAWLLAKAKEAGLVVSDITLLPTTNNNAAYKAIGYQMVASGSLSSVVSMLYEFYRSPQLHQISRLQLTRPPGAAQLTVSLDVEALEHARRRRDRQAAGRRRQTPQTGQRRRLQKEPGRTRYCHRLLTAAAAHPAGERREPPKPPKFDESELAYFSGAVSSGNGWQAWINVRTTGETLHLRPATLLRSARWTARSNPSRNRSLVFKTGDKRFRVALGESLRKGKEIDAKGAVLEEKPAAVLRANGVYRRITLKPPRPPPSPSARPRTTCSPSGTYGEMSPAAARPKCETFPRPLGETPGRPP